MFWSYIFVIFWLTIIEFILGYFFLDNLSSQIWSYFFNSYYLSDVILFYYNGYGISNVDIFNDENISYNEFLTFVDGYIINNILIKVITKNIYKTINEF
jgi:hypothetical protein